MTSPATSAVLVGREAEMAALRAALKRADTTEPVTVLVGGEAGVGKTRLVDDFGRFAAASGAQILTGRCTELGDEGPPLAPLVAALRELLRRDGPAAFAGLKQEFGRLLPELAPAGQAGPTSLPDPSRGYLFDLVTGLLDRLAAQRPLVLVIEDLHWADRSTRDLITFLVRQARASRVLLVGTYRADALHRGHPLRAFLAELERVRGVERLDLDRLDRDGTAEILTDLYGSEPYARVVDGIHERAQGNPFFIEQLAATSGPTTESYLPDSLRDLLLARVDRLPEATQRVLRVAAAAGSNRVGHRLLAAVVELPDAELEEAMRAAITSQLVLVDPDEVYEFRHALVCEAVHDDLLPGERARLHARYAAAIETDPALVGDPGRVPAAVAYHWHAAHDHPRALTAAAHAADAAGQRYAFAEKSGLLERVLELWEQVPDAAARIGMDHLDVLEAGLHAADAAGDRGRALALAKAALSEVDKERDPQRAARLLERQAHLLCTLGKSDGAVQIRAAYRLAGKVTDPAARAALLADIAYAMLHVDEDEGGRIAQEAAAAASDMSDVAAQVSATITHGLLCCRQLSPEVGLAELRRAAQTAESAGDGPGLVRALVTVSDMLYEVGQYAESAESAGSGIADARRFGINRSKGAFLLSNRAEALLALGRWDEAETVCAESARLDLLDRMAVPSALVRSRLRLARGHPAAAGTVKQVLGYLARPYVENQFRLPLRELQVTAALGAGGPAGAVAAATEALADPALGKGPRYAWPLLAAAARTAVVAGDAALPDRVRTWADSIPVRYPAERAFAAQVAAELTGGAGAYPAWRAAVAAWRDDGQPYPRGYATLRLAEAAAAAGDRAAAAEAVAAARAVADELAATPLRDAAETLARRLGLRAAGRSGPGQTLTSREREVLRLVAAGHSNRRIAEELYITAKTASVHVSRIIAKLAVTNRVEAAAVAHRLGLLNGEAAASEDAAGGRG